MIRAGRRDTALHYRGMLGTLDTAKAMLYLENDPMQHEKESMTEKGNSPCKFPENITRQKDEMRTKLVQVWLDSRKEPRQCRRLIERLESHVAKLVKAQGVS